MKTERMWMFHVVLLLVTSWGLGAEPPGASAAESEPGYLIENDLDVAIQEPPPHDGAGMSTAYSYFTSLEDLKLIFRKRILQPGATVGYHEQKHDEIYYVVSGTADLEMNGKTIPVGPGDAILTRGGSWHGLRQTGTAEFVFFIVYEEQATP